jgi:hypothetical protein
MATDDNKEEEEGSGRRRGGQFVAEAGAARLRSIVDRLGNGGRASLDWYVCMMYGLLRSVIFS